jgi:integrase/recombinase XerD
MSDLISLFLDDVCAGKHNETRKSYKVKLAQLERFAHGRKISGDLIRQFEHDLKTRTRHKRGYRMIEGGLSPYTIKSVMQTVRHFCRWLYDEGHMIEPVYKKIKIVSPPPPLPKAIDASVVMQLVEAAQRSSSEEWERFRNVAIMYYLRDTGGRVGGMCRVELSSINLQDGTVETIEKGRNVKLYINKPTVDAIAVWLQYRKELDPITDHLFISKRTKQGITRQGVLRMLNATAKHAKVSGRVNPHAWRHAFARDFLKNGGELSQLAGLMHHSTIWITHNYYARWNDRELHEAHTTNSPINQLQEKMQ